MGALDIYLLRHHLFAAGVGDPDYDVFGPVLGRVGVEDIWGMSAASRALSADQHAAVDVLERLSREESIHDDISLGRGEAITETRYLLDAPAGAVSASLVPHRP